MNTNANQQRTEEGGNMSQAQILVVEDDLDLREAIFDTLELAGYSVVTAADGYQALSILDSQEIAMVVSDVQMDKMDGHTLLKHVKARQSNMPMVLMTAHGSIPRAVEAMRNGAIDYLSKPFEAEVLVNMVGRFVQTEVTHGDFVAEDEKSKEIKSLAARVAKSDATILVTGASGVGKEVLARYIHEQSPRADKPFVAINCAAIPESMLEATLFGYEKGAFTGAYKASPGKFEQAQGGTILLDEITEMDLGLQAKLLRVLQEREVERLGGGHVINLDVRVLATSNRNMREYVSEGKFREDLFYRLNVFPLTLLPLCQRSADIVPIAERILASMSQKQGRATPLLSDAAKHKLSAHSWPGNVRELDNVMQRAMILQMGELISAEDIHYEETTPPVVSTMTAASASYPVVEDEKASLGSDVKHHEYGLILEALQRGHGSRKFAAETLGISPRTLRYKMAKMREEGIAIPA